MNEHGDASKTGSRRKFLRTTGVAAGGVALIGPDLRALAQAPGSEGAPRVKRDSVVVRASAQSPEIEQTPEGGSQPATSAPPSPSGGPQRPVRASAPADTHLKHLGPLHNLSGTWMGAGFNLISLPDFVDSKTFRLKLNATREILEFSHIGGAVPNRGSLQTDISIFGLTYLQRVSDAETNAALHIEPGLWLYVPKTTEPNLPATVVRQGSIPHGTSIMAIGNEIHPFDSPPKFEEADSTPFNDKGLITNAGYLKSFLNPQPLPPKEFKMSYIKNPNLALQDAIADQKITETQVLKVSASDGGGILNIPSVMANAKVTEFDATFWIEKVLQPDGVSHFMQLQYTQRLVLFFKDISWPHISVATLVKQ